MITTIVLPVSRPDFLKRIFAQLEMMSCDQKNTNLLVYVDGDMRLFDITRNFVINSKFNEKLCVYRKKGLPNVNHIRSRRKRIGMIHSEIKDIIVSCDYVWLLEDDTLFPLDALTKLLHHYDYLPHAGLITAVQVGRWGYTVPGIWKVDSPYEVTKIESLLPNTAEPFHEIDASGLYCCLTRFQVYKHGEFTPFDSILGPDVTYGLGLRKLGYKNYVDWSINTSHLTKRGEIKVTGTHLQKIIFTKIAPEKWEQEVIE